jgi:dihydroorotate dehydrogenase
VGLAAGLDKDGHLARFWPLLGFGFVELGTVTRYAQPGNPRPRLFRLPESKALLNRMGFNNQGVVPLVERLRLWKNQGVFPAVPVGVNLGKSKRTPLEDAAAEYVWSATLAAPVADYLTINVSSPNTPGLRSLQEADSLRAIVAGVVGVARGKPVFVKLSPDLSEEALGEAVRVAESSGASGLIATNTTTARAIAPELGPGGLSGAPLFAASLAVVRQIVSQSTLPVIACGGISSLEQARAMLNAGAQAVQLYTGLVFEGPGLPGALNRGLAEAH